MQVAGEEASPLLERERECGALEQLAEETAKGSGSLATIDGGAGAGKSRLVAWSAAKAIELGMTVLEARGEDLEQEFAFGIALQLLAPWLARATAEAREAAWSGAAALAKPLFDAGGWEEGRPPSADQGLLHGLHWLIANIAEQGPLQLLVDDAHFADEPSLRFLRYLAPRLCELPVSVVVAARQTVVGGRAPLEALLARATVRLELEALSRDAVGTLALAAVPAVDEPVIDSLAAVTGGNPLFCHELLRAMRDGDVGARAADVASLARLGPRAVGRHILIRLARCGDAARVLAGMLAVLGDRAPLRRAVALGGLDGAAAARAADALVAEEIVVADADGGCTFAHPIVREAVLADLSPIARGRAHLQAARLLSEEGCEPEAIVGHLLAAPASGEAFALEAFCRAARRAIDRGAPAHAVRYLRRTLEEPLGGSQRAELLVELALAEARVADPAARGHLDEALAVLTEPRARGRALMALGRAFEERGRHGDAAASFERAAGELAGEDHLEREAMAAYARAASIDLRPDAFDRIAWIAERPEGDEVPGERSLLALAAMQRTSVCAPREEAIALARRAWGDGRLLVEEGAEGRSWSVLTGVCTWNGALELSETIGTAALEAAIRSGSIMASATASFCLAMPLADRGRLAEALAHATQALEAVSEGWETYRLACVWIASRLHLDRGEVAEATRLLAAVDEHGAESADRAFGLDARGRLRLLENRAEEALEDHLAAGRMIASAIDSPAVLCWQAGAALSAHRLGDDRLARELTYPALERARATGVPKAIGRLLQTAGLIESGTSGLELLRQATQVLDGLPLERSWALLALGATLRRSGQRVEARAPLREALDLASRCGAALPAARAREELRASGARPRRAAHRGVDALTPSELRVARMASEGMTNREIAQALFVTVHTVDKHLRGTFEKLSISSRRSLEEALGPVARPGTR